METNVFLKDVNLIYPPPHQKKKGLLNEATININTTNVSPTPNYLEWGEMPRTLKYAYIFVVLLMFAFLVDAGEYLTILLLNHHIQSTSRP